MLLEISALEPVAKTENSMTFYHNGKRIVTYSHGSMLTGFKSTVAIGKLLGWDVIPLDFHNYSYHGQIYPGYEVGYGQNVYSADELIGNKRQLAMEPDSVRRLTFIAQQIWSKLGSKSKFDGIEELIVYLIKQAVIDYLVCGEERELSDILFDCSQGMFKGYGYFPLEKSYLGLNKFLPSIDELNSLIAGYKSGPFSNIPLHNIVAERMGEILVREMSWNLNESKRFDSLKINPFHKYLVLHRMKFLMGEESDVHIG